MATILDVAKYAGVSISTVSNVLNKSKYVSEDLTKKVYESVEKLNYVRDSVASNMKRGYTKTIGVITSDICGLFYPYVLKGIYNVSNNYDYSITIYDSHVFGNKKGLHKEEESFRHLFSNKVDGIIFVSSVSKDMECDYINNLKKSSSIFKKTPLVSLERDFSQYGIDSVFYDNTEVVNIAVEHLVSCGCKNIVFIGGPINEELPEGRKRGYLNAMAKNGFFVNENEMIEHGDYTHESGYKAMKILLSKNNKIDGIYVANDQMAIGALKYLKEKNIKIPEDVKLIGTDNVFISSVIEPSISTINIQKIEMGKLAANILFKRIEEIKNENINNEVMVEKIPTKLVVRKTTDINYKEDSMSFEW